MTTGTWKEKNIMAEFVYSPLFEMLAAMHVFCSPSHHRYRRGWYKRVSEKLPRELAEDICRLGEETEKWMIPMDFAEWDGMERLGVADALKSLETVPLSRWNLVFSEYGREIGSRKKKEILKVMDSFYELHFSEEFRFLEPFLKQILIKERGLCGQRGLHAEVDSLHERIEVTEEEIILHKNREYRFRFSELDCIRIWGRTFLAPHLIMGTGNRRLTLVLSVLAEQDSGEAPEDLVRSMKALGDATRLKILRALHKGPASTQGIAAGLALSEAAQILPKTFEKKTNIWHILFPCDKMFPVSIVENGQRWRSSVKRRKGEK